MMPRARERRVPTVRGSELVQVVLFALGSLLLPVGIIVVCLGWYGAAHTPYEYDQTVYLLSGGALGLGLSFVGGILYVGAWLARIAAGQAAAGQGEVHHRHSVGGGQVPVRIIAGESLTVHRAECTLLAGRTDLRVAGPELTGLTPCSVCSP
jgi:hypothetical protein